MPERDNITTSKLATMALPMADWSFLSDIFYGDRHHDPLATYTQTIIPEGIRVGIGGCDALPEDMHAMTKERQLESFTWPQSVTFPAGMILFHAGARDRNQFDNNTCCFFTSAFAPDVEEYVDIQTQYFERDNVQVDAYILTGDVTLYNWFYQDMARAWNKELPVAVAEKGAHQAMTDLGLDGKWNSESRELMLTPNAYDRLKPLPVRFAKFVRKLGHVIVQWDEGYVETGGGFVADYLFEDPEYGKILQGFTVEEQRMLMKYIEQMIAIFEKWLDDSNDRDLIIIGNLYAAQMQFEEYFIL